ncbi:MAG: tRNA pseudouridine(38-40) synthase TruA [Pseudomonadales bacterium]|nr:tRNA pseudouridine(38-40) synthase TruA [Pseudomonadales bacterium]
MPDEKNLSGTCRYALQVEYRGTRYSGWQLQKAQKRQTVQGCLQAAISSIANESVNLVCAGRTDAGVHATAQMVHFETRAIRKNSAWVEGVNTLLPKDIRVQWSAGVEPDFHARFSATARRYMYLISNSRHQPAIAEGLLTWCREPLDADAMHLAGQNLLGENDFSSFRASGCQSLSPNRNVMFLNVYRLQHLVVVDIKANAFLHHMVRNMVGTLLEVGAGHKNQSWVKEVLDARQRTQAGKTAPADGLYLVQVDYPAEFGVVTELREPPVLG